MKTVISIILFCICSTMNAESGHKVKELIFEYDQNGNIVNKIPVYEDTETSTDVSSVVQRLKLKSNNRKTIASIYMPDINDYKSCELLVLSTTGEILQRMNINKTYTEVDISNHPNGIYVVTLNYDANKDSYKFLIK
ncbi:MAG: hypothetical protein IKO36_12985 [Bacteroidaceae bacterium]|nr:hypothetical protein [Bacteroidaceae bacterium]